MEAAVMSRSSPAERSVQQARWLLIPVFSLYGGMMLIGLFLA